MKRRSTAILVIFSLLFASIALFGCTRRTTETASGKTRLVYWEHEDATAIPFLQSVIDAFLARPENRNIEISRVHYGTEELRQQFQTASIARSGPDFITAPSDYVGVFSVAGFIHPVNQLVDLNVYEKTAIDSVSLDGKAWGIPVNRGNHLMLYYNRRLAPQAPATTEELFRYCDTEARQKGLSNCLAYDMNEPYWLVPWFVAFGGRLLDQRTPQLDSPAMVKTLNFLRHISHTKKYVPNECDYNCMDTLFKEQKVAFIINGDWALSVYEKALGQDLAVARIPRLSETGEWPAPFVSGRYFMLNSDLGGERLKATLRFTEFFTNEGNQLRLAKELRRLPALKAATEMLRKDPAISPLLKASESQLQVGQPMPAVTELRAIWEAARAALGRVMTSRLTPEQGAKAMQADAISKIREMDR